MVPQLFFQAAANLLKFFLVAVLHVTLLSVILGCLWDSVSPGSVLGTPMQCWPAPFSGWLDFNSFLGSVPAAGLFYGI